MYITYIRHSAFLVELEQVQLLFDYVGGPLPEFDREKDLMVFASHRHEDHFSPKIFGWAQQHPRVHYILSYDIWKKRIPDTYARYAPIITKAAPGQNLELAAGGGSVAVYAYRSTDEGVAFVVKAGGKTVYHAGDLNDWHWEGEDYAWNRNMQINYLRELKQIHADGHRPQAAMVPVDGRLGKWFYLGLWEYMEEVGAGYIFPMHFWKDYAIISQLKTHPSAAAYCDRIADIREEGQKFRLEV